MEFLLCILLKILNFVFIKLHKQQFSRNVAIGFFSFKIIFNDYIAYNIYSNTNYARKSTIKNKNNCIIALLKALRVALALVVESQLL